MGGEGGGEVEGGGSWPLRTILLFDYLLKN